MSATTANVHTDTNATLCKEQTYAAKSLPGRDRANRANRFSLMYPKCSMNLSVRLLAVWQAPHWQTVSRSITTESLVKVGEHAQALVDELFAPQRFALAIEQHRRIAFDLGQREVRFIRGDDKKKKRGERVKPVKPLMSGITFIACSATARSSQGEPQG